jgi:hypothetical protein
VNPVQFHSKAAMSVIGELHKLADCVYEITVKQGVELLEFYTRPLWMRC